jgi:hypothetical protein
MEEAREVLGPDTVEALWTEACGRSLDDAIATGAGAAGNWQSSHVGGSHGAASAPQDAMNAGCRPGTTAR